MGNNEFYANFLADKKDTIKAAFDKADVPVQLGAFGDGIGYFIAPATKKAEAVVNSLTGLLNLRRPYRIVDAPQYQTAEI